jgi:type I restriction enzyme S subunit
MAMYGATIGKLGILEIESATNQACCVFGKPNDILIDYFFYILLAFRLEIVSFGYGGGQPNISQDLIKSLRFPIATNLEQKAIVKYITEITNRFSTAISLKEQEIEKLKEYKATLINSAVTGKIKVV